MATNDNKLQITMPLHFADHIDQQTIETLLSPSFVIDWVKPNEDKGVLYQFPIDQPVVLIISTVIGGFAALGLKKVAELLVEDLYKSAKSFAKSLFKQSSPQPREARLCFKSDRDIDLLVVINARKEEDLHNCLIQELPELVDLLVLVGNHRKCPPKTALSCYQHDPTKKLSEGDVIPADAKSVLIENNCGHDTGWRLVRITCDLDLYC